MKKKILFMAIPSIIFLGILIFALIYLQKEKVKKAKYDGVITIEIINLEKTLVNEEYHYKKGDTLVDILTDEYNATITNSEYGAFIESFSNCVPDNSKGEWIIFYINDQSATEGISFIELTDGYKYTFKIEVYS